ncbi:hypothetical protein D3C72_2312960 [compost metagenome]
MPAELFAGRGDFLVAKGRAMGLVRAFQAGGTLADSCAAGDQRRLAALASAVDRLGDGFRIMTVDGLRIPAGGAKAGKLVHRGG